MTDHEEVDGVLRRTIDELRTLPTASEDAVSRLVAAARVTPQDPPRDAPRGNWYYVHAAWRMPAAVAAGLVLAAGVGGYALRSQMDASRPAVVAAAPPATQAPQALVPVAAEDLPANAEMPVATQFVLDAPAAQSVALVGDFNAWDPRSAPLARDPQTGLWTLTLPVIPGRHVYAFLVDGTQWTLDPRAPQERDADFGRPGSVLLVEAR
ncbi:MAG TPA: isoamylase early set domain-containing protein [Gemmatimonadaceae bacterium]